MLKRNHILKLRERRRCDKPLREFRPFVVVPTDAPTVYKPPSSVSSTTSFNSRKDDFIEPASSSLTSPPNISQPRIVTSQTNHITIPIHNPLIGNAPSRRESFRVRPSLDQQSPGTASLYNKSTIKPGPRPPKRRLDEDTQQQTYIPTQSDHQESTTEIDTLEQQSVYSSRLETESVHKSRRISLSSQINYESVSIREPNSPRRSMNNEENAGYVSPLAGNQSPSSKRSPSIITDAPRRSPSIANSSTRGPSSIIDSSMRRSPSAKDNSLRRSSSVTNNVERRSPSVPVESTRRSLSAVNDFLRKSPSIIASPPKELSSITKSPPSKASSTAGSLSRRSPSINESLHNFPSPVLESFGKRSPSIPVSSIEQVTTIVKETALVGEIQESSTTAIQSDLIAAVETDDQRLERDLNVEMDDGIHYNDYSGQEVTVEEEKTHQKIVDKIASEEDTAKTKPSEIVDRVSDKELNMEVRDAHESQDVTEQERTQQTDPATSADRETIAPQNQAETFDERLARELNVDMDDEIDYNDYSFQVDDVHENLQEEYLGEITDEEISSRAREIATSFETQVHRLMAAKLGNLHVNALRQLTSEAVRSIRNVTTDPFARSVVEDYISKLSDTYDKSHNDYNEYLKITTSLEKLDKLAKTTRSTDAATERERMQIQRKVQKSSKEIAALDKRIRGLEELDDFWDTVRNLVNPQSKSVI